LSSDAPAPSRVSTSPPPTGTGSAPPEGQTAIVTGASSGIGKAIAIALGAAGSNVCVNYVTGPDKAEDVVAEIENDGSHAFAQQADVSSEADVLRMFEAVRSEFGAVDILINNAGLQSDAPFIEMTRAQWQKVSTLI